MPIPKKTKQKLVIFIIDTKFYFRYEALLYSTYKDAKNMKLMTLINVLTK